MSNLSDLLPAGAAAKQLTFTDSGSGIATKKPVILNSDGTVAEVAGTTTSAALADIQNLFAAGTSNTSYNGICYATTEDRIVVVSANDHDAAANYYPFYTIGTMSSGAITWTTPVVISSYYVDWVDLIYQSNTGRLVLCYHGQGAPDLNKVMCLIGTFGSSPYNTISWAGKTQAFSQTTAYFYNQLADWPGTDKFVIVTLYNDTGSSYRGGMQIGTVGGASSLSFGAVANFTDGLITTYPSFMQLMYDTGITNQFIVVYQVFGGTPSVTSKALTVSGTTITDTTAQNISSGTTVISNCVSAAWDSDTGQALVLYGLTPTSATTAATSSFAVVSTASGSTTPNTPVAFVSGASSNQYAGHYWNALTYDSYRKVFTLLYFADDSASYLTQVTVSGTTPTQGSNLAATGLLARRSGNATVFDPDSNLVVGVCTNGQDANRVNSYVYTPSGSGSNLTAQAFVGVADSAISASAAGSIIVQGGTVAGLTDPFGTVSATYGSPTAASAYQSESKVLAYDSANNRFVMAYKDGSNSDYGTAVVGELSGTSITWGTPVVFNSGTTGSEGLAIAFDSNVNRIVIAYQDQGNSSYGTAIVGSVSGSGSGSTIAFGAESVFLSSSTKYIGMEFDSNDNRIVIVYSDVSNATYTYRVEYVIGTVTTGPDAISFNTPAPINGNSDTYEPPGICFDASENKILIAYTNSSYDLYVVNLAVSSGSGTPGTASSYSAGQEHWPRAVYDSVNSKCGVSWATNTGVWPISFSVISMSGASVTINTPVQAGASSDSNPFMHNMAFDSNLGQIAISTRSGSSTKGIVYYGSISGTTSSWGAESLFADETILPYGVDVAYDTSANKLAFVYSPLSGSNSAAVVGTLAVDTFTAGTKYYVTTSGGFSSSADTPSVNAGLAISTTSLLLNGDS